MPDEKASICQQRDTLKWRGANNDDYDGTLKKITWINFNPSMHK